MHHLLPQIQFRYFAHCYQLQHNVCYYIESVSNCSRQKKKLKLSFSVYLCVLGEEGDVGVPLCMCDSGANCIAILSSRKFRRRTQKGPIKNMSVEPKFLEIFLIEVEIRTNNLDAFYFSPAHIFSLYSLLSLS